MVTALIHGCCNVGDRINGLLLGSLLSCLDVPGRLFAGSVDDLHHRASQHGVKYEPQVFVRRSAEVSTVFVCRRNSP